MCNKDDERLDEVAEYYKPVKWCNYFISPIFWILIGLSLSLLFLKNIPFIQRLFILLVVVHFLLNLYSKHLLTKAEEKRRKQLVSDAFGVQLSNETTRSYYNNCYPPSFLRLGAIIFENAFFGKEIVKGMLYRKRLFTLFYLILWFIIILFRHNDLGIIIWLTQFIFSSHILAEWFHLEILGYKYDQIYNQFHSDFLNNIGENTPQAKATLVYAFANYESAKSSAAIKLSTRIFERQNPDLTKKWEKTRMDLGMDEQRKT